MTDSIRSEALLRLAVQTGNFGFWEWNLRSNKLVFSETWRIWAGDLAGKKVSAWPDYVHPDDLPKLLVALERYSADPSRESRCDVRFRDRSGAWRNVSVAAEIATSDGGTPSGLVGTVVELPQATSNTTDPLNSSEGWTGASAAQGAQWPLPLRAAYQLVLGSDSASSLYVGSEYEMYFNSAWAQLVGVCSEFSGKPARVAWDGAWEIVRPLIETAFLSNCPIRRERLLLPSSTEAAQEERYFDFKLVPVRRGDEVVGIWNELAEVTHRVIQERRSSALSELSQSIFAARSPEEVLARANKTLVQSNGDLAFCLAYLAAADSESPKARLVDALGVRPGSPAAPYSVDLLERSVQSPWPLARLFREPVMQKVEGLDKLLGPDGDGSPIRNAVVIPLIQEDAETKPSVFFICAVNLAVRFDELLLQYLGQVAHEVGRALARVRTGQTEKTWHRQMRLAEAMFKQAISCFAVLDLDLRFVRVNEAYARYFKIRPEEFVGRRFVDVFPDDETMNSEGPKFLDTVFMEKRPYCVIERPVRTQDQSGPAITYWDWTLEPILDEAGDVEYLFFSSVDVTERKKAKESLAARVEEYRSLAENSPDSITRYDSELRILFANPVVEKLLGKPKEALIGKRFSEHFPGERSAAFEAHLTQIFQSQVDFRIEMPGKLSLGKGAPEFYDVQFTPERGPDGKIVSILVVGRDITEQKKMELYWRTLVENIPNPVLRFDRDRNYLFANAAMEKFAGTSAANIVGKKFGEATDYRNLPGAASQVMIYQQAIDGVFATEQPCQLQLSFPLKGETVWFDVRIVPEWDIRGQLVSVLSISHDITRRVHAEKVQKLFRALVDRVNDSIEVVDPETGRYVDVNLMACEAHGYSRDEYLKRTVFDIGIFNDKSPGEWKARVDFLRERGQTISEGVHRRKDGSTFPVEVSATFVFLDREYVVAVVRDITKRRQLETQLRQSQKMDAFGQLAGGIAHDFNNILAVIQLKSSMMTYDHRLEPETKEGLQEILFASQRAASLTRQLLTFSRREVMQTKTIDLAELVSAMTKLLRRLLGEDIVFEKNIAQNLPPIDADPGMIEQVVMNLAINARDAMTKGGRLTVSLNTVNISAEQAAKHRPSPAGTYACLTVVDTGSGIPPGILPRIFEPFFTTKEVGKGTGLGLATVFGIVQQHHGWIDVETEVDRGTAFHVYLPALENAKPPSHQALAERPPMGGDETVLLVEDEPVVRAMAKSVLNRFGYRVIEMRTAALALGISRSEVESIDLLLTDLVMPGGVTGRQLAQEFIAMNPRLKILYMSGYRDEIVSRQLSLVPGVNFLLKPFAANDLAHHVRRALDAP